MKVKLKDSINSELTSIGLRPGMEVRSNQGINKTTGAVHFTHYCNSYPYDCVVWPEDYEVVEEGNSVTVPISQITFVNKGDIANELTLPISEITNTLDAMHWCFAPYLDDSDLSELPWIENLIKSYNSVVRLLPSPWDLQYELVDY